MESARFQKNRFLRFLLLLSTLIVLCLSGLAGLSWYLNRTGDAVRNVILISIDTCRADHLSCYGFERPTTPRLDEIAGEGTIFTRARSPIPLTLPAHCSMFTGTYPPYHQVHDNVTYKLSDSNVTLAEILQENGLATGAIVSSFILNNHFGTHQGFDSYNDTFEEPIGADATTQRRGAEASRFACDYLEKHQKESFFLFLHYFDPHDEYIPPEPFATRYADDLYSGEIAYADQCVGEVIEKLKELGLYDSTLLVIVGDHGESLGEHGESTHGYFIYQSTIHVPFIIRAPGMNEAKEIDQTVSLVDVAPTILGYLDLPIPTYMQGNDLSNISDVKEPLAQAREVYTESLTPTKFGCNPLFGVVSGQWDYIHSRRPELYDLEEDPSELNNLAEIQAQRVRLMSSRLEEMVAQLVGAEWADSQVGLDAESRRRLESLGYIGDMTINENLTIDASRPDPKDMIECFEYKQKASNLFGERKYAEALAICEQMISRWPQVAGGHYTLMEIASETNKPADVIKYGRQYLALATDTIRADESISAGLIIVAYDLMVQAAMKLEKFDVAVEFCRKQLELWPNDLGVLNTLGLALFKNGQQEQAFKLWMQLIQNHPEMAEVYLSMGLAYYELGDAEQAEVYLTKAVQLRPALAQSLPDLNLLPTSKQLDQTIAQYTKMLRDNPQDHIAHDKLGQAYCQKGDLEMGVKHWLEALQLKPDWPEVHNNLGQAYYLQGRQAEALEHWRESLRLEPEDPTAYINLTWLLITAQKQNLHNPAQALQLAQEASKLTENKRADVLEALSIAYAANGKLDDAIATAEKGLQLALTTGDKTMAEKFRKHLKQFRSKREG